MLFIVAKSKHSQNLFIAERMEILIRKEKLWMMMKEIIACDG